MYQAMELVFRYFFPGECYDKVIGDFNFFDVDCLTFAFSRCLSLSILMGAVLVKLPQIIKLMLSGSTEGLSYFSFLFELAAVTITSGYNYTKGFPFNTWGESFFIAIQLVVVLILMFAIERAIVSLAVFVVVYCGISYCLYMGQVPLDLLQPLQGSTILLVIISKLIQVGITYQSGSTGQQAFITALMNWLGTAGRIFTTFKETMDPLLLVSFTVSFGLNTLIMGQFLWYWNVPAKQAQEDKEHKD